MIEINLLPGARKRSRSKASASFNVGALVGDLGSKFRDPWMIVAVVGVAIGLAATGFLWWYQGGTEAALVEREQKAVQDSTRYAAVIAQRQEAEAQRDSILKQVAVITAIDGNRYIWPHILDEISSALPTYTWLRSVNQSTPVSSEPPEIEASADTAATVGVRVIGLTVDIQALTMFMKQLEASPWIKNVALARSEITLVEGKEVTQFQLEMVYERPDPSAIRTVPLSVSVR